MKIKLDSFTIVYKDGSRIDGYLLPERCNRYYKFVDISNGAIWNDIYKNREEFVEYYNNAPGVEQLIEHIQLRKD